MVKRIFLIALFLLFPLSLKAQEVVVTATRIPEVTSTLPTNVQIITKEEIEASGAQNLGELLAQKHTGHLHMYPGLLTSVGIRGFRTDTHGADIKGRVLILVDGHRAGTGNVAAIPLENVERIEIIKGPASVVYGSAAMGGVINIITRKGYGKIKSEAVLESGNFGYTKQSAGIFGGIFDDKIGISASLRRISRSDYKVGDTGTEYDNTAYNDDAISVSLQHRPVQDHEISFVWQYFNAWRVGMPGSTYWPDPDNYKNILRNYFSISYDGKEQNKSWHLSYYSVRTRDQWNDPSGSGYFSLTQETETEGLRNTFSISNKWGKITFGLDYDKINVLSYTDNTTYPPYTPNSMYENYAVFLEQRLDLSDNTILRGGVRYDYFKETILPTPGYQKIVSEKKEFDHVSWRGGIIQFLTNWLNIRATIGTAFRIPTADEFAGIYKSDWGNYTGNPNLKPEKSTTYEVGLYGRKGNFAFGGSCFYTLYENKIVDKEITINGTNWKTYENIKGAKIAGIEGYFYYNHKFWLFKYPISFSPRLNFILYLERKNEDETLKTDTLLYIPWGYLTLDLNFKIGNALNFNLNAFFEGSQKIEDYSTSSGQIKDKEAFIVLSLYTSVMILKDKNVQAELYLSIKNLMNEYYEFVDGYPMPGRWIVIGTKGRF